MNSAVIDSLDVPTTALVRLAACIAAAGEPAVRTAFADCAVSAVPARWVEEVVLQSYLFAGFPRALNAAREWRRSAKAGGPLLAGAARSPEPGARASDASYAAAYTWRVRGEETCRAVYGASYERLRANIAALHPALDDWMIVEGYGKVLARDGLDMGRRELCVVAACAAGEQDRQLHSHLRGAQNVGVPDVVIGEAVDSLRGAVADRALAAARLLWQRVRGK